jgi:glycerophosphoryl diester phosphodiesterase
MNIKSRKSKIFFAIILLIIVILVVLYFVFGGLNKKRLTDINPVNKNTTLIFAHRGIANYFPENSYEALQQAKLRNFKAIEIDLNQTSDSVIILFHDNDCERMLGIKGDITAFTLTELNKHPYRFNDIITKNKVLTLDETFRIFGKEFIIYLDIKNRTYDFMEKVIYLVKKYHLENSTILSTADFFLITRIEFDYPEINTCLEGFNAGKEWIYYFIPSDFKPDYYASFIHNVDKAHIDWMKQKDLLNYKIVYGVDTSNYIEAKKLGLKNILIDYDSTVNMQEILK